MKPTIELVRRSGGDRGWPFNLVDLISELMVAKLVDCPPTVPQYCCCTVLRPPKTTVLAPSSLLMVIWFNLVKISLGKTARYGKTYGEQGAGRCATTVGNDSNLLGVEQSLGRGVKRERLALLAQLLTEKILVVVDNFPDRVFEPIVVLREECVVAKGPVVWVIQQFKVRIRAVGDGGGDGSRERLSTSLGVEAGLWFRSTLGSGDNTMEPVGNANISAAIVCNVNDQLLGTGSLEVLQTCEEILLEIGKRGCSEATKSQNTGLSLVQVVKLGDRIASSQWWQSGDKLRWENNVGRGSIVEDDVERVFASLTMGDLGLLLNAGGAVFNSRRSVVVNTVGTGSGFAVPSAERGAVRPSHGRRRNTRAEWDLIKEDVMSLGEFQREPRVAYGESLGEDLSLTQDRQLDGVTQGEGLTGELSQNIIPATLGTLIRREEARRPCYFCTPGLNPNMNLRVLASSQALITTSNRSILINDRIWKFVIDQENLCTAKLNGFVR